jgi:DNA repair protein RadC
VIGAAWGVVLMHNHPSGDPAPSDADRRTTQRLKEAGNILQIVVIDHVIVGHPNHCSFVATGLMP